MQPLTDRSQHSFPEQQYPKDGGPWLHGALPEGVGHHAGGIGLTFASFFVLCGEGVLTLVTSHATYFAIGERQPMKSGALTPPAAPLLRSGEGFLGRTRRPRRGNGESSRSLSPPRWAPWSSPVPRQCYLREEGAVLVNVHVVQGWHTRFLANMSGERSVAALGVTEGLRLLAQGPPSLSTMYFPGPDFQQPLPGQGPSEAGGGDFLEGWYCSSQAD